MRCAAGVPQGLASHTFVCLCMCIHVCVSLCVAVCLCVSLCAVPVRMGAGMGACAHTAAKRAWKGEVSRIELWGILSSAR